MKFKVKNPNPRTHGKSLYRAPEHITIETLPSGKLDAFETWELQAKPDRPLFMVCDCCLNKSDRLWVMKHYGFCIRYSEVGRGRRDFNAGAWAFCVNCWPLFIDRAIDILVARVVTLNADLDGHGAGLTYHTLREAVHGDVMTWESGQSIRGLGGEGMWAG